MMDDGMIKWMQHDFKEADLLEDGFWRSLGLGLWIPKAKSEDGVKEILMHKLGKERWMLEMDEG